MHCISLCFVIQTFTIIWSHPACLVTLCARLLAIYLTLDLLSLKPKIYSNIHVFFSLKQLNKKRHFVVLSYWVTENDINEKWNICLVDWCLKKLKWSPKVEYSSKTVFIIIIFPCSRWMRRRRREKHSPWTIFVYIIIVNSFLNWGKRINYSRTYGLFLSWNK